MMKKAKLRTFSITGVIEVFAFLTVILSLSSLAVDSAGLEAWQLFELTSHFKLQYLVASGVFLSIFLYLKRRYYIFALTLSLVVNGFYLLGWYIPVDNANQKGVERATLTILHANLLSSNTQYDKIISLVGKEKPDIISLQEVSFAWEVKLNILIADYPYYQVIPRRDNFGIALFSKLPLIELVEKDWGQTGGIPSLLAKLKVEQRIIQIASTHPLPPINNIYFKQRNKSLLATVRELATSGYPSIMVGDFNITMWSPNYNILQKNNYFENARKGKGLVATWPAFLGPFGIPIDHVMVSNDFTVQEFRAGPNIGSDHLPIVVKLRIKY
jgi:endonuclease/exonuclease/phosphatase (EEP) superfamily protein YafD